MTTKNLPFSLFLLLITGAAAQAEIRVPIHKISASGVEESLGEITLEDTKNGLLLSPHLHGLPQGIHGFHVHEHASCDAGDEAGTKKAGLAAGPHLAEKDQTAHKGPYQNGHLGDLPALSVTADGSAALEILAPRLSLKDVAGHTLMIHQGGDNYSDAPQKLGGGGDRIACGIVPAEKKSVR